MGPHANWTHPYRSNSARHLNDRERHFLIGMGLSSKRSFIRLATHWQLLNVAKTHLTCISDT